MTLTLNVSEMALFNSMALLLIAGCCFAQEGWQIQHMVGITRYPALPRMADIQGTAEIRCSVADDGTVRECRATSGHPLLIAAAIENAKVWMFKRQPSTTPVSSEVTLIYSFELLGEPVHAEPRTEFSFDFPNHIRFASQPACADHAPCPSELRNSRQDGNKRKPE